MIAAAEHLINAIRSTAFAVDHLAAACRFKSDREHQGTCRSRPQSCRLLFDEYRPVPQLVVNKAAGEATWKRSVCTRLLARLLIKM